MIIVGLFLGAVFVGFLAQKWKRRTGALWWFMTMVVQLVILAIDIALMKDHPEFNAREEWIQQATYLTFTLLLGTGGMSILVATLPNRTVEHTSASAPVRAGNPTPPEKEPHRQPDAPIAYRFREIPPRA